MKKEILAAVLFFSVLSVIFSEKLIIQETEENWNIGISDLKTYVNDGYDFFGKSVSAYLLNKFSVCRTHQLSENEILNMKSDLKNRRTNIEENNLSEKQISYDKKYFTDEKNRKDLKNEIRDIKKLIKKVQKYKLDRISISSWKNINFTGSADNEKLVDAEKTALYRLCSENNLDYLIYGKVNIFEDVVFTDISLYSRLDKKNIYTMSQAFDIKSYYSELDEAVKPFFTKILGKSWSSISILSDDKNADIFIDDEYSGTGSISEKILDPGDHSIRISGTGIKEKTFSVSLAENQHYEFDADSDYEEEKLLAVNTFPDEADIYYDSLWQGKSPVVINSNKGEIFIRKEGFREQRVLVEDLENNYIDFKLSPELFKQKDYLLNKRDVFYKNLSWFVLSAPVPFFMFAVLNDYNNSYNSAVSSGESISEIDRLEKIRNYCYYGYYGTLFISMSLFVNMIFHLDDYIKAGDILE